MKRAYLIFFGFLVLISACSEVDPKNISHSDEQQVVYDGDFRMRTNAIDQDNGRVLHQADTQEINRWIAAAAEQCFRAPDSTRMLLNPVIRRSLQLDYVYGLGHAYNTLGVAAFNEWKFKQAQMYFLRALAYFGRLDSGSRFTPKIFVNLGHTYVVADQPDSAFYYY